MGTQVSKPAIVEVPLIVSGNSLEEGKHLTNEKYSFRLISKD